MKVWGIVILLLLSTGLPNSSVDAEPVNTHDIPLSEPVFTPTQLDQPKFFRLEMGNNSINTTDNDVVLEFEANNSSYYNFTIKTCCGWVDFYDSLWRNIPVDYQHFDDYIEIHVGLRPGSYTAFAYFDLNEQITEIEVSYLNHTESREYQQIMDSTKHPINLNSDVQQNVIVSSNVIPKLNITHAMNWTAVLSVDFDSYISVNVYDENGVYVPLPISYYNGSTVQIYFGEITGVYYLLLHHYESDVHISFGGTDLLLEQFPIYQSYSQEFSAGDQFTFIQEWTNSWDEEDTYHYSEITYELQRQFPERVGVDYYHSGYSSFNHQMMRYYLQQITDGYVDQYINVDQIIYPMTFYLTNGSTVDLTDFLMREYSGYSFIYETQNVIEFIAPTIEGLAQMAIQKNGLVIYQRYATMYEFSELRLEGSDFTPSVVNAAYADLDVGYYTWYFADTCEFDDTGSCDLTFHIKEDLNDLDPYFSEIDDYKVYVDMYIGDTKVEDTDEEAEWFFEIFPALIHPTFLTIDYITYQIFEYYADTQQSIFYGGGWETSIRIEDGKFIEESEEIKLVFDVATGILELVQDGFEGGTILEYQGYSAQPPAIGGPNNQAPTSSRSPAVQVPVPIALVYFTLILIPVLKRFAKK